MSKENLNEGVQYTVQFINNSSNSGNMMVFQKDPNMTDPGIMSLAWFTKFMHPTTKGFFQWTIDYNFVWAETGELKPGVRFLASQSPAADLSTSNKIQLTYEFGAYNFKNQTSGKPEGSLYVVEDNTIPLKMASVGIGMSNAGTFVKQAQPNMSLTFSPHPEYWIAFGNFHKGQVLDIQEMTNDAHIKFPVNVYAMSAILNADNTWTIEPVAKTNARYLKALEKDDGAIYGE